jgi:hypothetical protein
MYLVPWVVAFIEGFSTLAVEVIAIRLAVPVVGSSIVLTGVMLGVVLLALSAGYWRGGALSARWDSTQTRNGLMRNLLVAAVLYGAVAFPLEAFALEKFLDLGLGLAAAIGVTALLLLLFPIYLASQTVPMLAELTNVDGKAGRASGKVLFFSTMGSVAGGIVTPVWLFPTIGVAHSTWIVCGLLATAACVMGAGHLHPLRAFGLGTAALALVVSANAFASQGRQGFYFDSAYQTIRVLHEQMDDGRMGRTLVMGGGSASGVYDDGQTAFAYVKAAEKALAESHVSTVLVIGAAGFTFPRDAAALQGVDEVDAVDVDPVVKRIAEREFLKQPLPSKIRFMPLSARYAVRELNRDRRRYGFTYIDAYIGHGIPDELLTTEFFRDVRLISGHTAVNIIVDRTLQSAFARNVLASFRDAYGAVWVQDVKPGDEEDQTNVMVTSWPAEGSTAWNGQGRVYHDDRNSADRDHVNLVWNR